MKKIIKMYLNGSKDANCGLIEEDGLKFENDEAERMFLHALTEVVFDVEIDLSTGEAIILTVDGKKLESKGG